MTVQYPTDSSKPPNFFDAYYYGDLEEMPVASLHSLMPTTRFPRCNRITKDKRQLFSSHSHTWEEKRMGQTASTPMANKHRKAEQTSGIC
ncbi:uncharacterized protein [Manis javanica]|uniref:uncharacterized protein n=1 Tax=Manis javanica TaxID=9974 RepID=UPI003C6CF9A2